MGACASSKNWPFVPAEPNPSLGASFFGRPDNDLRIVMPWSGMGYVYSVMFVVLVASDQKQVVGYSSSM